ncbi:alpha/beta hydrolase [Kutzneria viridogrisea]|uniref:Pimeloyl-ACP methyl ester carboxylesterase n=1 Tax=Kutzneria viridogrisea TaxID=47990 RepID=A0ABR6BY63_9PSEU|nr:pimeloyl-ACP methyl ester carboxylesterase [Kutzneria viridogrisea]
MRITGLATALALTGALALAAGTPATASAPVERHAKPTIVLVHGAFEDAAAWSGVTARLQREGYQVFAPANPLRGLASDAEYLRAALAGVSGPLVLVGHSYGGMVISEAAAALPSVTALVYVAAFIPRAGESALALNSRYPGSLLGPDTTRTVDYPGGTDLYVRADSFRTLFAADRGAAEAAVAAAGQRPIAPAALNEPAAHGAPPAPAKYALVAAADRAIPPAAERFMAQRAGARTTEVPAAHDLPASQPGVVAATIERAAR